MQISLIRFPSPTILILCFWAKESSRLAGGPGDFAPCDGYSLWETGFSSVINSGQLFSLPSLSNLSFPESDMPSLLWTLFSRPLFYLIGFVIYVSHHRWCGASRRHLCGGHSTQVAGSCLLFSTAPGDSAVLPEMGFCVVALGDTAVAIRKGTIGTDAGCKQWAPDAKLAWILLIINIDSA